MARIDLPDGDELTSWLSLSPLGPGLSTFADAVYTKSRLSRREFEAARMRVAASNQCVTCLNTRYEDGAANGLDADFYDHIAEWATHPGYSERERLVCQDCTSKASARSGDFSRVRASSAQRRSTAAGSSGAGATTAGGGARRALAP